MPPPPRAAGTPAPPATATHDGGRYPPESLLFPVQVEKENFVVQELKTTCTRCSGSRRTASAPSRRRRSSRRRTSGPRRPGWPRPAGDPGAAVAVPQLVMENRDTEQALRRCPGEGDAGRGPPGSGGQRSRGALGAETWGPTTCRLCDLEQP